jgi:uncharacterized protein
MKKSPVVHFEMPVGDNQRAVDFYKAAFGWDANILGPEMGNYTVVMTTDTDEKTQRPMTPGAINGGFFQTEEPNSAPRVVISVEDIQEAMKQVTEAGGKVIGGSQGADKPDDIPGVGLYAIIIDTEGNKVGILQPSPDMSAVKE